MRFDSLDHNDFVDIAEWQEIHVGEVTFDIPYDWEGHALKYGPKILEEIDVSGACNTPEVVNLDGFGRRVARRLTCPHKTMRFVVGSEAHFLNNCVKLALYATKHDDACGGEKQKSAGSFHS